MVQNFLEKQSRWRSGVFRSGIGLELQESFELFDGHIAASDLGEQADDAADHFPEEV